MQIDYDAKMNRYIDYMFYIESIEFENNPSTNVLLLNDNNNIVYKILTEKYNKINIYLSQDDKDNIPKKIKNNIFIIKEKDDHKVISNFSNKKYDFVLINNIFSFERFILYIYNVYSLLKLNGYLIINNYDSFRFFDLKKIDKIIKNFIQIYKESIEVSSIDNIKIIKKKDKIYHHISNELDEIFNFFNKIPVFYEPVILPRSQDNEIIFNIQYSDTEPKRLKKLGHTKEFDKYNNKIKYMHETFYQKIKSDSKNIDKKVLLFNILDYKIILYRIKYFSNIYNPYIIRKYTDNIDNINYNKIISIFTNILNDNDVYRLSYYLIFYKIYNKYYYKYNKNDINDLNIYISTNTIKIKKYNYLINYIKKIFNINKINLYTINDINIYEDINFNKNDIQIDIIHCKLYEKFNISNNILFNIFKLQNIKGCLIINVEYKTHISINLDRNIDIELLQILNYFYKEVNISLMDNLITTKINYKIFCYNFIGIKNINIDNLFNKTIDNRYLSKLIDNKKNQQLIDLIYNMNRINIQKYIIDNFNYKNKLIKYLMNSKDKKNIDQIKKYIINKQIDIFIKIITEYSI
jgi:hypothetical protein